MYLLPFFFFGGGGGGGGGGVAGEEGYLGKSRQVLNSTALCLGSSV